MFAAALYAFGQFWLTTFIFFDVAGGHLLTATIWIMCMIVVFVLLDRVDYLILANMQKNDGGKQGSIGRRILKSYLAGPSVKSTLYLLYMFVLVCSAILAADPDFSSWLQALSDYFLSMRYGILFLIASDKFFEQLFKDVTYKEEAL